MFVVVQVLLICGFPIASSLCMGSDAVVWRSVGSSCVDVYFMPMVFNEVDGFEGSLSFVPKIIAW